MSTAEVRRLLEGHWPTSGAVLQKGASFDEDVVATIVRLPGGNIWVLHRLPAQVERNLDINHLDKTTRSVVKAARERLVIGQV